MPEVKLRNLLAVLLREPLPYTRWPPALLGRMTRVSLDLFYSGEAICCQCRGFIDLVSVKYKQRLLCE